MEKQEDLEEEKEICKGGVALKKYHNKGVALNFMERLAAGKESCFAGFFAPYFGWPNKAFVLFFV